MNVKQSFEQTRNQYVENFLFEYSRILSLGKIAVRPKGCNEELTVTFHYYVLAFYPDYGLNNIQIKGWLTLSGSYSSNLAELRKRSHRWTACSLSIELPNR